MDGGDRHDPTGQDDGNILHELADVIIAAAWKDPEFVQQEMAGHANKIRNRNCDKRVQEMA